MSTITPTPTDIVPSLAKGSTAAPASSRESVDEKDESDAIKSSNGTDERQPIDDDLSRIIPPDFPLSWKVIALFMGVFLSVGSSFSENTLGPLKSTLRKELDITNAQYGAISSASSLVNAILPVAGGVMLDYWGVEWGAFVSSCFVFLGSVISASGTNQSSFGLVMAGRIVLGFGSTIVETCTSKILAHFFQHRGLGFVYGFDISFGKLIVLAAKAAAVPMSTASDFWGWALWIPAIVCAVNMAQTVFYCWWIRRLPAWAQIPTGRDLALRRLARQAASDGGATSSTAPWRFTFLPDIRRVKYIPRFFWLVILSQIMQAGVVGGFNGLSADIIRVTRGSTESLAGYTSSIQQVIPIVLAPSLGAFFDYFGYRMFFVSFVSALWVLVYSLIGYTTVNALGVMIIASLALAFNALPFIASIPLMVPEQTELGLALGLWKAFNNCSSVIVDMVAGHLQDQTKGQLYERVVAFFIAYKSLEFFLGLSYGFLDRRYLGGILTMSERKRKPLEEEGKLENLVGRQPARFSTTLGLSIYASLIIISYVLFIKFSL
ncbi:hypothetical protein JCM6882_003377 [Rhodosporidiobolus microsporus]